MRAGARDARAPGLLGLGGVPLLRVPSHDSELTEEGWGPLAGLGPVPEHRGKDDAVALGLSACGQCRSPDCPLLTQVQGQPGKRRREEPRAGAGPVPRCYGLGLGAPSVPTSPWGLGKLMASLYRGNPGLGEQQDVQGVLVMEAPGSRGKGPGP